MKLADLDIIVTAPPPPGWGGRYWQFVKVTTACGIVGWGEVYAAAVGPEAMAAVIRDVFERHMAGENPENVELMFRRVYSAGFTQRPDPTVMGAFSGLEIACWDIVGKARERPVWALMGGRMNDRLRAYTYLYPQPGSDLIAFFGDAEAHGEEAARRVAEDGFTALRRCVPRHHRSQAVDFGSSSLISTVKVPALIAASRSATSAMVSAGTLPSNVPSGASEQPPSFMKE